MQKSHATTLIIIPASWSASFCNTLTPAGIRVLLKPLSTIPSRTFARACFMIIILSICITINKPLICAFTSTCWIAHCYLSSWASKSSRALASTWWIIIKSIIVAIRWAFIIDYLEDETSCSCIGIIIFSINGQVIETTS